MHIHTHTIIRTVSGPKIGDFKDAAHPSIYGSDEAHAPYPKADKLRHGRRGHGQTDSVHAHICKGDHDDEKEEEDDDMGGFKLRPQGKVGVWSSFKILIGDGKLSSSKIRPVFARVEKILTER